MEKKLEAVVKYYSNSETVLSSYDDDEIGFMVLGAIDLLNDFLKGRRKLGFIETLRSNPNSIFPDLNEQQSLQIDRIAKIKEFCAVRIDNKLKYK